MRVLFISEGLDKNSIIAQPWRHMYEIASSMVEQSHEVAIATDSPYTHIPREQKIGQIPTYILPKTRLPPTMSHRISTSELQALVEKFSPEVIYWDGGALIGNYIRKARGIDKPIVVHISTNLYTMRDLRLLEDRSIGRGFFVYALTMSSGFAGHFVRLLNKEPIKMITVPNESIEQRLAKVGVFKKRIQVLPTPFRKESVFFSAESSENFASARDKIGLGPDDFVVAYFGPPQVYRGTDTLLYAAARLKHKLPQLKIAMLMRTSQGSQDRGETLLKSITSDLQLNEKVKFVTGILAREDLLGMIRSFDVVALPFKFVLNEPPITALEAMALGKPLITTRVSGLPALVGDNAFLVEPRNDSDLADAIYFIAKNFGEARERGRRAREQVLSLPEWNDYAKHVLELFERVRN